MEIRRKIEVAIQLECTYVASFIIDFTTNSF